MFDSVLVANRGEIARRVIRTARQMGIRAVAVYSEADEDLPYVHEADEAIGIGPAQPARSYLDAAALIAAAAKARAAAVHPGYGFLAENADFARQAIAAGLVDSRKDGRWIYYSLPAKGASAPAREAIRWVAKSLAGDPRIAEDAARL